MSDTHDPYEDQLSAARYRAERDQARQEAQRLAKRVGHLQYLLDGEHRKAERRKKHIDVCEAANGRLRRSMGNGMTNQDVEAAKWVREQGGLKAVRSRLMPEGYEWDDRLAGAVDFFEAMHDLLYTVDCDEDHDGPEMVREVMRRLMPDGYEWPRYEDGQPMRIHDSAPDSEGRERSIVSASFHYGDDGVMCRISFMGTRLGELEIAHGERVKRPQVLAADGEPIEPGQTMWHTDSGERCTVIEAEHGHAVSVEFEPTEAGCKHTGTIMPENLTHQPPAIAADGEPLEVGQKVWHVDGRGPYEVANFKKPWVRVDDSEGNRSGFWPDNLTHQRPVLDADGVPIHEGDELWITNDGCKNIGLNIDGEPLKVSKIIRVNSVACLDRRDLSDGSDEFWYIHPKYLTHTKPEPPDSWEQVDKDATDLADTIITEMKGHDYVRTRHYLRHLVRRFKRLAGVSE